MCPEHVRKVMCARYWKVKMGKTPSVRVSKEPRRHSEKKGILGAGEIAQLLAAQEWGLKFRAQALV